MKTLRNFVNTSIRNTAAGAPPPRGRHRGVQADHAARPQAGQEPAVPGGAGGGPPGGRHVRHAEAQHGERPREDRAAARDEDGRDQPVPAGGLQPGARQDDRERQPQQVHPDHHCRAIEQQERR